jgi:hypothetical protein
MIGEDSKVGILGEDAARHRAVHTLIVALAFAAGPAVAQATTWCVRNPSCPAGGNSSQTTIAGAAAAAGNNDTILIGPGKFMESINDGAKLLTYIGAGPAATVIQAPTTNTTTFATGNGLVANLGIELGGGSSGTALFFGGTAINVAITAPPGTTGGLGVALHGGSFENGTVRLPNGSGVTTTGIASGPSAGGAVQDSTVTASTGINDVVNVARDRIFATHGINASNGGPGGGSDDQFVVDDTLVDTTAAGPESGIVLNAGSALSGDAVSTSLTIRHSTLIGDDAAASTGVAVNAQSSQSFVSAQIALSSTIVRGYATALSQAAVGSNAHGAGAGIFDDYSDFNPALETVSNTGNPVGFGTISDGTHNLNVAPGFVNATAGNPLSFHLLAISPLIDAGQPALSGGESPLDLAGAPRVVPDHRAAVPLSDIGAFEYQPHPPIVRASVGAATVATGKRAAFRASGTDPDPGDQLTFRWSFDDGGAASGANVAHAFSTPGLHKATVTVTDLDGLRAAAHVEVRVVSRPKNVALPVIKGSATIGKTLSSTSGTWSAPSSFSRRWQDCNAAATSCANIASATAVTYKVRRTDAGHRLRIVVTAANAAGSTSAASAPTARIRSTGST